MEQREDLRVLNNLLNRLSRLNKEIVDREAVAIVLAKDAAGIRVDQYDIVIDFVFFCFTKVTKTVLAIRQLNKSKFYEDSLILTRSNFEAFICAKAVLRDNELIDNFVEYKLGMLENNKYRFKRKSNKTKYIEDVHSKEEYEYIDGIKDVSILADELFLYQQFYGFLSEATHCHMITSGYYKPDDASVYSYNLENDIAYYNTLLINIIIAIKFFRALIHENFLELDDLILKIKREIKKAIGEVQMLIGNKVIECKKAVNTISDQTRINDLILYISQIENLVKDIEKCT
jgi:hypothetical protein